MPRAAPDEALPAWLWTLPEGMSVPSTLAPEPNHAEQPAPRRADAPYLRAGILGVVLLAALLALTPYNDYFIRGSYMANHHVPVAASFVLLLLCLIINPVLAAIGRRGVKAAFSTRELAVVWGMMAVSSGLASAGFLRFLFPTLAALHGLATPENKWEQVLFPLIPSWLAPSTPRGLRWFYDGGTSFGAIPWGDWLPPILAWSLVGVLLWSVMLCLATILRAQWVEHERMTFIHVQLPMALVEAPEPGRVLNKFLRDRLMWIGFLVPVVLYGVMGLGSYFPAMPKFSIIYPNFYSKAVHFEARPWNAAGPIYFAFMPSVLGFGFLLTTEVSLSTWVFFILFRLQAVMLAAAGLQLKTMASSYGAKAFMAYQDMGGYLALAGITAYVARGHLRRVWEHARRGAPDADEAMPPRLAVFGGLAALGALVVLANLVGIRVPVALGFFGAFFVVCIGVSWLTSTTGVLQLPVSFRAEDFLYSMAGTRALLPVELANLAIPSRSFTFYYNELQMPHYLNLFKLAGETKVPLRTMTRSIAVAVLLGLGVAWVAHLALVNQKGAYALQQMSYLSWPRTPFEVATATIRNPQGPDPMSYLFVTLGGLAFVAMMALRANLMWWPLHPAGLLMGGTMQEMWFSLLIAWLCKTVIMRYSGARGYQRARGFFLGLAMGEAAIACIWIAIGFVTGTGVRLLP